MVSLLCGCCNKKKDFTFYIERILFFRSNTENLNASINEEYDKKEALFDCGFNGYSCMREKTISSLFDLGFYFSAYTTSSIEKANTPLHMENLDDEDYAYKIGTDFLNPLGKTNIISLPSASDIISYFSKNLFFPFSNTSDYLYFCVPAFFNYKKYTSHLSFTNFSCYSSSSPFFIPDFELGLSGSDYFGIHTMAFNIFSKLSDLVNNSLVYEIDDFISIFNQDLSSFYSKFSTSVTNFDLLHSYFSVYRFSKKDYYAYLQNYTTTRQ